ncbi:MAG: VTT domain-containing protein [Acidobacteria bacterium]|nr:VTT domain-containing protein [Acidobacteriota bacterium]
MKQGIERTAPTAGRTVAWRAAVVSLIAAAAFVLYANREVWQRLAWLQEWGAGPKTAALIVAVVTVLLTCGLTASAFLILTPLLFPPHWSAAITTCGFTLGAAGGYAAARYVGGAWANRFRGGRVHGFLTRHSSFLALFGLRLAPASPHSLVSYAAGLTRLSFGRFILATLAGAALKSYVYALAVHSTVRVAGDEAGGVGAPTLLLLLGVALVALVGHLLTRRRFGGGEAGTKAALAAAEPTTHARG